MTAMNANDPKLSDLTNALIELEQHVNTGGWDQPPRLYALVDQSELRMREPELAATLGIESGPDHALVPIDQEWAPAIEEGIDGSLAQISWPDSVLGAAVVIERYILPADAEEEVLAGDPAAIAAAVDEHPAREEVRLVAGVTRDGRRMCALRLRSRDSDLDVLSGEDLLPGLTEALATTFE